MINYTLIRKILFKLDPELAHALTMFILRQRAKLNRVGGLVGPVERSPCEVMGLTFSNRIGCAPGFDKDGDNIEALGQLGFGFLEVGGVTARAQPGNPKPRLFRLVADEALINRMGFNNRGVDYLVENLKRRKYQGVVGVNIAKNKETALEKAAEDYVYCMQRVYAFCDFMTINISSPNTPGLRELQNQNYLSQLLSTVKIQQQRLSDQHKKYVPLVVKLAPDLDDAALTLITTTLENQKIDGVIATNTTLSRPPLISPDRNESGGLSGKPLTSLSTEIISKLYERLPKTIPIIAVGGIMSAEDAIAKRQAGAQLVQLYSGLIYHGPQLIADIAKRSEFCV
jgi:dihydroorotate dehydrogenase